MKPSAMILFEGTLSFALPVGWAVWELLALRRRPPGGSWDRPTRIVLPQPTPPVRVLEDA